jgi:outer membrane receptor protein involved in Fe transport
MKTNLTPIASAVMLLLTSTTVAHAQELAAPTCGRTTPTSRGRRPVAMMSWAHPKNIYNLESYYENHTLSARVAYTYRSAFLVGLDGATPEYADGVGNLAASINYKLNDRLTLTLDALNLNNPVLKYYGSNKDQPRAFYSNGRQYYVGFQASI